uniref:WXG100 family type VII secretion target n=1 Tax=Actinoalloteichus spitiensis TaxID=252394 RepID=UPI00037E5BD4
MFPDRYSADRAGTPDGPAFARSPGIGDTRAPGDRPPWLPEEAAVGGPDGDRLAGDAAGHLGFLSWISDQLGVPDPVHEYFGPVVGRWSDMHEQAEHWRVAARRVEELAEEAAGPLGGLDEAWTGEDADSFVEHVQEVVRAANAMADTMIAVADALDVTADAIRQLVRDMVEVLAGSADSVSEALTVPVAGEERARDHLVTMREPLLELFEAVREVLRALVGLCSGLGGDTVFSDLRMAHVFPEDDWTFDVPSGPGGGAPGAVDVAGAGAGGGGGAPGGGGGGVPSGGGGPGAGSVGAAPESDRPVH